MSDGDGVNVGPVGGGDVEVIDPIPGLEVYTEASHGIFLAEEMVTIAFYSPRTNHVGKTYRLIIARVTMPLAGTKSLASQLGDFLDRAAVIRKSPPNRS